MKGFSAWLIQRLTAIYMAIFIVIFLPVLLFSLPINYQTWHDWFSYAWFRLSLLLFFFSLLFHAWVGIRDVVMDYIHPTGIRLLTYSLVFIFLLVNGLWVLNILWLQ